MNRCDGCRGVKGQSSLSGNLYFWSTNMLLLKEKLSIEVAHFNCVKINLKGRERESVCVCVFTHTVVTRKYAHPFCTLLRGIRGGWAFLREIRSFTRN